jgi:hypothetical protein
MIIVKENSRRVMESDDQRVQKMAYEFFKYLTLRGLPKGIVTHCQQVKGGKYRNPLPSTV